MSLTALLVLAVAVVPAFAFATLGWLALSADTEVTEVTEVTDVTDCSDNLRNLNWLNGMHLENR